MVVGVDERTLIRASRLEFGKHFTKAPVGANDFRTVQNLLMTFLSSSKTEMKGGLSNMLQCQADVARNLEHLGLAGLLNVAEVRYSHNYYTQCILGYPKTLILGTLGKCSDK